jgi:uncharacterized protein YndB with AHSA1/START domain
VIDLTTTLELDRPPEEVFAFVADHRNAPRWQGGLHEVRRLTDGPLGVGTEHEFVRLFAGRRVASRNRFVEFEPGRFVRFEFGEGGWIHGTASYRALPGDDGGCRLESRMAFHVRGPGRLVEPLLARVLARDVRRDDARLKALLEAE